MNYSRCYNSPDADKLESTHLISKVGKPEGRRCPKHAKTNQLSSSSQNTSTSMDPFSPLQHFFRHSDTQSIERLRKVRDVVCRLGHACPSHNSFSIYSEAPRSLPPTPTLRWLVPYFFLFPKLDGRVHRPGIEDMPGAGNSQSPLRVELTFRVYDDAHIPLSSDCNYPFFG
jgi:hypothetical protein